MSVCNHNLDWNVPSEAFMDQQAGEDVHWFPQLESNKMVLALCESFLIDNLYILSKH